MNQTDLSIGDRVRDLDQDDDATAIVFDIFDDPAYDHDVADTGQTVAEYNDNYPDDDQVVQIAFEDDLPDNFLGLTHKNADLRLEADDMGAHSITEDRTWDEIVADELQSYDNCRKYSYPCSRLEKISP